MAPRRRREPTDVDRNGRDEERLVGRDEKGRYDRRERPVPPRPKKKR